MSRIAKKFHLDPDGYLTTKPDHLLTTEEEATDAAEAAIEEALGEDGAIAEATEAAIGDALDEALGEGGAIAEAIAASNTCLIVDCGFDEGSVLLPDDVTFSEIKEAFEGGTYVIAHIDGSDYGFDTMIPLLEAKSTELVFASSGINANNGIWWHGFGWTDGATRVSYRQRAQNNL